MALASAITITIKLPKATVNNQAACITERIRTGAYLIMKKYFFKPISQTNLILNINPVWKLMRCFSSLIQFIQANSKQIPLVPLF